MEVDFSYMKVNKSNKIKSVLYIMMSAYPIRVPGSGRWSLAQLS